MRGSRSAIIGLLLAALPLVSGCGASLHDAVPEPQVEQAAVSGLTGIRYWGDAGIPNLDAVVREKFTQMRRTRPHLTRPGARPGFDFLAISGGGGDGAFGAGLLVGWGDKGTRPEFEIVTGVSTGALTAPFAFLGPRYDHLLRQVFTSYSTRDLVRKRPIRGLLGGSALADNRPLARIIARFATRDFLKEIAHEHSRGRRLLIGTSNLDAQRPVIWDMGRIAASGHPGALQLFRRILLASAAIPVVFPPVMIEVEVDGRRFQEMHVDGGITADVFLLPGKLMVSEVDHAVRRRGRRRVYVIRNGRLAPEWKPVEASTYAIALRSVSTLIKNQSIGDLYKLHDQARRDRIEYRLARIPDDVKDTSREFFDPVYMRALFEVGYRLGREGYPWLTSPHQAGRQ